MVQKEQSNFLLGQKKAVVRPLHHSLGFDRPIPSKFSQAVEDKKLEDKKWRMWVVTDARWPIIKKKIIEALYPIHID